MTTTWQTTSATTTATTAAAPIGRCPRCHQPIVLAAAHWCPPLLLVQGDAQQLLEPDASQTSLGSTLAA